MICEATIAPGEDLCVIESRWGLFLEGNHRVCFLNQVPILFLTTPIHSSEDVNLSFRDYHVIVVAPITTEKDVNIEGQSIFELSKVAAKGQVTVAFENHLLHLSGEGAERTVEHVTASGQSTWGGSEQLDEISQIFRDAVLGWNEDLVIQGLLRLHHNIKDLAGPSTDETNFRETLAFYGIPDHPAD